ncbi:LamG domain-containing protein [Oceanidesulfovibrio marinus]|nr:LamG domain-containing protein [Oceanidesulfovibrio marinus]
MRLPICLLVALLVLGVFVSPVATRTFDITHDLAAYYPLNGNTEDESGNHNHAALVGPVWGMNMCARPKSALQFYPQGHSYMVADTKPLSPVPGEIEALTLAAWIYPTRMDDTRIIVDKFNPRTQDREFRFALQNGKLRFIWAAVNEKADAEDCDFIESANALKINRWHHVAASYQRGKAILYVNGEEVAAKATRDWPIYEANADLQIGGNGVEDSGFFNGKIDDLRVYTRALEVSDIQVLAARPCQ